MTQPEEPESERAHGWQPTWISDHQLTFLGDIQVGDADFEDENPEVSIDVVGTGEDHG